MFKDFFNRVVLTGWERWTVGHEGRAWGMTR